MTATGRDLLTRNLQAVLGELLHEEPVVIVTGARTVGKSTLLAACAAHHGVTVLDLDDLETRRAVMADPALFVSEDRPTPVCIDEFQHVPPLLDAIKSELNRNLRPGRYMLTGSTRYGSLPTASQSLTGRAHVVTMWPLSQGELAGRAENTLDALVCDPSALVVGTPSISTRADYEQAVLGGGFPLALAREPGRSRNRWFRDFVNLVVERDVMEIRKVRQRQFLPQVLRRLAGQTGQVVNIANLADAVGLDAATVKSYLGLLEAVFLIHRLEPFTRSPTHRAIRSAKVHAVDTGLAAYLIGLSQHQLAERIPAQLTQFGHLVETFTVNELMKQAGWAQQEVTFSHFRTKDQQEVDLVIETETGSVSAVEVKASGTVTNSDFAGLRLLRDKLGSAFVGGVVVNLGQRSYTYDDRLHVLPLDRLWTS
ncbi:ATP-binding protein [Nocardia nova]|uniref:ATP-binding protein n=1 Tax=Nocardia nova TaxID=37330 RepID=A0A2S6AGF9_9NOCA|nr:ATP-binding protein [Nocardia nova]PPJ20009.1 ATP-binding protein [Nocardia nova]PPJ33839.1 ATP-binding protein [Nocardia nova]